jgi:hypothetical protein
MPYREIFSAHEKENTLRAVYQLERYPKTLNSNFMAVTMSILCKRYLMSFYSVKWFINVLV